MDKMSNGNLNIKNKFQRDKTVNSRCNIMDYNVHNLYCLLETEFNVF